MVTQRCPAVHCTERPVPRAHWVRQVGGAAVRRRARKDTESAWVGPRSTPTLAPWAGRPGAATDGLWPSTTVAADPTTTMAAHARATTPMLPCPTALPLTRTARLRFAPEATEVRECLAPGAGATKGRPRRHCGCRPVPGQYTVRWRCGGDPTPRVAAATRRGRLSSHLLRRRRHSAPAVRRRHRRAVDLHGAGPALPVVGEDPTGTVERRTPHRAHASEDRGGGEVSDPFHRSGSRPDLPVESHRFGTPGEGDTCRCGRALREGLGPRAEIRPSPRREGGT